VKASATGPPPCGTPESQRRRRLGVASPSWTPGPRARPRRTCVGERRMWRRRQRPRAYVGDSWIGIGFASGVWTWHRAFVCYLGLRLRQCVLRTCEFGLSNSGPSSCRPIYRVGPGQSTWAAVAAHTWHAKRVVSARARN
jgi:hypothetical protein